MARIQLRLSENILKMVVLAASVITFITGCNNGIPLVSVYKTDGSLQCQAEVLNITLEEMQQELISRDIQVHQASKSHDGLMHIQLCGSPTGNINLFTISSADLNKAKALGFIVSKEGENQQ